MTNDIYRRANPDGAVLPAVLGDIPQASSSSLDASSISIAAPTISSTDTNSTSTSQIPSIILPTATTDAAQSSTLPASVTTDAPTIAPQPSADTVQQGSSTLNVPLFTSNQVVIPATSLASSVAIRPSPNTSSVASASSIASPSSKSLTPVFSSTAHVSSHAPSTTSLTTTPTSTSNATTTPQPQSKSLSTSAIAGIVTISIIVAFLLVFWALYHFCVKRKRDNSDRIARIEEKLKKANSQKNRRSQRLSQFFPGIYGPNHADGEDVPRPKTAIFDMESGKRYYGNDSLTSLPDSVTKSGVLGPGLDDLKVPRSLTPKPFVFGTPTYQPRPSSRHDVRHPGSLHQHTDSKQSSSDIDRKTLPSQVAQATASKPAPGIRSFSRPAYAMNARVRKVIVSPTLQKSGSLNRRTSKTIKFTKSTSPRKNRFSNSFSNSHPMSNARPDNEPPTEQAASPCPVTTTDEPPTTHPQIKTQGRNQDQDQDQHENKPGRYNSPSPRIPGLQKIDLTDFNLDIPSTTTVVDSTLATSTSASASISISEEVD